VNGYGQVVDDFESPEGRYLVIWDLEQKFSWRALVVAPFRAEVGSLIRFERTDGAGRMVVIEVRDLPSRLVPIVLMSDTASRSLPAGQVWTEFAPHSAAF
jgi:hypothetical protein